MYLELPTVPFVAGWLLWSLSEDKSSWDVVKQNNYCRSFSKKALPLLAGRGKHHGWVRGVFFFYARKKCCFFISKSKPGTCCFFFVCLFSFLKLYGMRVPACVFGACVMSAVGCDAKHLCVCVVFNLKRSCYACSSLFLSYFVHVPTLSLLCTWFFCLPRALSSAFGCECCFLFSFGFSWLCI